VKLLTTVECREI